MLLDTTHGEFKGDNTDLTFATDLSLIRMFVNWSQANHAPEWASDSVAFLFSTRSTSCEVEGPNSDS